MAKDLSTLPRLRIKGPIMPNNSSEEMGQSFSSQNVIDFLEANKDAPEIVVEIESRGGNVSEGKNIYTRLRASGKKITTITVEAMSIATLLMLTGQKRLIAENAGFCIHQARVHPEDLPPVALLAEDLDRISQEVKESSAEILNIYCNVLGEDKRSLLLGTMALDTPGGARQAIKLGFANGYYDRVVKAPEASKPLTITAYAQEIISNNMADTNLLKTLGDKMEAGFASIIKALTVKIKAEVPLALADGTSLISDAASDQDLLNSNVVLADAAGVATQEKPADGDYPLTDGRTITVVAGQITAITDALDASKLQEENKALKTELEALKAAGTTAATEKTVALAALEAKHKTEMDAFKASMSTEVSKIKMEFDNFKKQIPGEVEKKDEPEKVKPVKIGAKPDFNEIRAQLEQSKIK